MFGQTKKVLDRLGRASATADGVRSTTQLGDWYVNVLFWKPPVALFVSETRLLPGLIPFAPVATLIDRFPSDLHAHLQGPGDATHEYGIDRIQPIGVPGSRGVLPRPRTGRTCSSSSPCSHPRQSPRPGSR